MPIDFGRRTDRERLHKAIKTSREAIIPFRDVRMEIEREYVGSWYSKKGARLPTIVNKLNQTATIYSTALAFDNPTYRVTTFDTSLWPFARKFQVNINRLVKNIDLKTTLFAAVMDAFFLIGVCKVRMADAGFVETEDNVWVDPGKPWVDRVSIDDLIVDMTAKDIRAMRFMGDRYRVSLERVKKRDDFETKVARQLTATSKHNIDADSYYAQQIGSGDAVDDDELEPMIWLEDVYIPETQEVVTWCPTQESLGPLKVLDWDGHPQGPYKYLSLGLVPDNIMPTTPAQVLKALHDLSNRLYRKISGQAQRQKNIVAYAPGAEDDADLARKAVDGGYYKFRDPKTLTPLNFPGVDGNTHAFFIAAQEVYNVQAGNERVIGGLGQTASTLGQEEIIQGQAGQLIYKMKGAVNNFAAEIGREIGGLMYNDEYLEINSSMEAENTGVYVDSSWRPGEREGILDYYDFCVEPNSMAYKSNETTFQKIVQYVQLVGTVFPLVQAGVLDVQELTKLASELQNIPDLVRIFKFMNPEAMKADQHAATKPPVTSRETVRNNVSQGPQGQGMQQVMGQMMQGQNAGITVGA